MYRFTIRADGSKLKVQCLVSASQREMLQGIRRAGVTISNDTTAYCHSERRKVPRGHVAIVFFSKTHLSHGTVAHEFVHAGLSILARRKVKNIECTTENAPHDEEELAGIVGDLADAFYKKYGV